MNKLQFKHTYLGVTIDTYCTFQSMYFWYVKSSYDTTATAQYNAEVLKKKESDAEYAKKQKGLPYDPSKINAYSQEKIDSLEYMLTLKKDGWCPTNLTELKPTSV